MLTKLDKLVSAIKEYIRGEYEKGTGWVLLNTRIICSQWKVPVYLSTRATAVLRLDPYLRYRFIDETASRFRARQFAISTPEEKIKDVGKVSQFEFTEHEESILIGRLKDHLKPETLYQFYTLMFLCEKMKLKNMDIEWCDFKINEYARLLGVSNLDIVKYIDFLIGAGVVVKSPFSETWRLTITEEAYQDIVSQFGAVVSTARESVLGKVNIESIATKDTGEEIEELRSLKRYLKFLLTNNAKATSLLTQTLKVYDALSIRDKSTQLQRATFNRLNEAYMEDKKNFSDLQEKYEELNKKYNALNRAFDKRAEQVQNNIELLSSNLTSIIEEYFQLLLFV